MRINESRLRQIIREEVAAIGLQEGRYRSSDWHGKYDWVGKNFKSDDASTWRNTPYEYLLTFDPQDPETWLWLDNDEPNFERMRYDMRPTTNMYDTAVAANPKVAASGGWNPGGALGAEATWNDMKREKEPAPPRSSRGYPYSSGYYTSMGGISKRRPSRGG